MTDESRLDWQTLPLEEAVLIFRDTVVRDKMIMLEENYEDLDIGESDRLYAVAIELALFDVSLHASPGLVADLRLEMEEHATPHEDAWKREKRQYEAEHPEEFLFEEIEFDEC